MFCVPYVGLLSLIKAFLSLTHLLFMIKTISCSSDLSMKKVQLPQGLLTLFTPWEIFPAFLSSADFFFKINFFVKKNSGIPSEGETNWIQIRPRIFGGVIWDQTVCKNYQPTTLGGK